ncbi:MAG: chemotaxis protein CheW, partial [Acetobacteraceae bacterium]|nr:chemotaxis protein CheW [Acetobacteraceae bacterium]
GDTRPMAVPLRLVARLEQIPRERIALSASGPVVQYRGRPMPLVALSDTPTDLSAPPTQPVLVFADGERSAGLMVDEIVDVVEDRLNLELSPTRPGVVGTAVIGGQATDVIDTAYWLARLPAAHPGPFPKEVQA